MAGTAIDVGGAGGKAGGKKFISGSRGNVLFLVRANAAHALADKDGQLMPLIADAFGNVYVKDSQIPLVVEALEQLGLTNSLIETLTQGITVQNTVKVQTKVVSCPSLPKEIPGIGAGAEGTLDCLGTLVTVEVPPTGTILSATYFDLDYEKSQVDLELFKHKITQVGDNVAWTLSDEDSLHFVHELSFFAFDDHIASATSEITNIGKAYTAPEGKFWIQAKLAGTAQTIAAGKSPRFQLQILSDDPDWQEG